MGDMPTAWTVLAGLIGVVIYFVPSMVAVHREHAQKIPILLLNIFLGWSILGWVVALVWAAMPQKSAARPAAIPLRCPSCGSLKVQPGDVACARCGMRLTPAAPR